MKKQPKLSDIGKRQPFEVPDGYFRDLPDRIMEQCGEREQKKSVVQILKPALSLAAMFIGVAVIAYFAVQFIDQPKEQPTYTQKDIAEAEYLDQIRDQEELMESINQQDMKAHAQDSEKTQKYIEYLLNEDIDYTTLINELKEKQDQPKDNP